MCVSHLKHTARSSSKAMTPALSTNTDRHQSTPPAISSSVAAAIVDLSRLWKVTVPSAAVSAPGRAPPPGAGGSGPA